MQTHADKSPQSTGRAAANSLPKGQSPQGHEPEQQLKEYAPGALAFGELQAMANGSSQAQHLRTLQKMADSSRSRQLQAMADNSPQVQHLRALQKMADSSRQLQPGNMAPIQFTKFGSEPRFQRTFRSATGLTGIVLGGGNRGGAPAPAPAGGMGGGGAPAAPLVAAAPVLPAAAAAHVAAPGAAAPAPAAAAPVAADEEEVVIEVDDGVAAAHDENVEVEFDDEPAAPAPAAAAPVAADEEEVVIEVDDGVAAAHDENVEIEFDDEPAAPVAAPAAAAAAAPAAAQTTDSAMAAAYAACGEILSNGELNVFNSWFNGDILPRSLARDREAMRWIAEKGDLTEGEFYDAMPQSSLVGVSPHGQNCHAYSGLVGRVAGAMATVQGPGSQRIAVFIANGSLAHSGLIIGGDIRHTAANNVMVMDTPIGVFLGLFGAGGNLIRYE